MTAEKFSGQPPPKRGSVRYPRVVTVTHHWPLVFVLAGTPVCGYWTHWVSGMFGKVGQTRWCDGTPACEWCRQGLGQRWCAFAAAFGKASREPCVPMFTEQGGRELLALCRQSPDLLRGTIIEVSRLGTNPNSPQHIVCMGRHYGALPEPFDHEIALQHVWGLPDTPTNLLRQMAQEGEGA